MNSKRIKYVIDNKDLLLEWYWEKNIKLGLNPQAITVSSQEKIWWKCVNGHSWQASVAARHYRKQKCPYCTGNKTIIGTNDFCTLKPELAKYWDEEKNALSPSEVSVSSGIKVWWICKNCGERFLRRVANMKRPYCCKCAPFFKTISEEKSLGGLHPNLLEEWDWVENTISPYSIKPHYNKKVWWICKKHQTNYYCSPDYRVGHGYGGCPDCKKEKLSEVQKKPKTGIFFVDKYNDILEKYYDYENNLDIDLSNVSYKSNQKAQWKCKNCGASWSSKFQNMADGRKCPNCETRIFKSFPEQCIFYYVQYYFKNAIWGYNEHEEISELDVFIPDKNIGIEYDGEYYHKDVKKDKKKDNDCKKNGIKLIRVREPNSPKYESSSIKVYRTRNNQDDNYEDLNNITKIVLNIIETSTKYDINIDRDISKINELCQLVEVDDSLERNFPIFAKQWDSVKNGTLTPSKVSKCSDRECYFICQTCGISFKRRIASLIRATSCECSECARKRAHKNRRQSPKEKSIGYLYPSIANELLNDENVTLDIYAIYPGSEKKYLWKCKKCGNIYEMSPKNRTNGHSCPKCAKENRKIKRGKKVVCIETGEIFNSISEASRTKKADASEICKCCKKETFTAKGYHWKYFEES